MKLGVAELIVIIVLAVVRYLLLPTLIAFLIIYLYKKSKNKKPS